ncbi:hypothetical protein KQI61_04335 [Anaerocolumna aminovalerica]|uniref:phage tail terminator family protein n=1 Tax=Anaerocolumna aminovalerica TaxID=1527 RepID=UPI001C0F1B6F|nr:hypothetical protein [Anaerocolumna aminovalerica]MBU5331415.1 hypothetical protein [Anaerocolumna aminovalerica]
MITPLDIRTSALGLLKKKYPKCKRYGNEVMEGFDKPSFFMSIMPITNSNASVNFKFYSYSIIITYFPKEPDEIDSLTKAAEIEILFGYQMKVKDRLINITDYSYDFVGNNKNILQITIDVEFYDDIDKKDNSKIADKLYLRKEKR